jgi:hydrogenase maturation protease
MGALDGLRLLMALDERLKRAEVYFIGIAAKDVGLGMELSDGVKAGVQKAVGLAERLSKTTQSFI